MSDQYEIYQSVQNYTWVCPPPCAFLIHPNEYVVWKNGEEVGKVIEKENCKCQKMCFPAMREYESTVVPKHGGNTYTVKRDLSIG